MSLQAPGNAPTLHHYFHHVGTIIAFGIARMIPYSCMQCLNLIPKSKAKGIQSHIYQMYTIQIEVAQALF